MEKKTQFYIDGKWVAPATPNELDVINPADETAYATISLGSKADVDAAVAAADKAFLDWADTPVEERIALIEKLAAQLRCLTTIHDRETRNTGSQLTAKGKSLTERTFTVVDECECHPWLAKHREQSQPPA